MRSLVLVILVVEAVLVAAPAPAQTYDPSYPICLQVYGAMDGGGYIECRYTSLAQCALSAAGRSATCVVNPYPAKSYAEPGPHQKRSRKY
jgi:hypothetical protein